MRDIGRDRFAPSWPFVWKPRTLTSTGHLRRPPVAARPEALSTTPARPPRPRPTMSLACTTWCHPTDGASRAKTWPFCGRSGFVGGCVRSPDPRVGSRTSTARAATSGSRGATRRFRFRQRGTIGQHAGALTGGVDLVRDGVFEERGKRGRGFQQPVMCWVGESL